MTAQPGITIPELADAMGIQANYLYRVMPSAGEGRQGAQGGQGLAPRLSRSLDQAELLHGVALLLDSSATVASIFAREKSSSSRPWTISHSPPEHVTGSGR